MKIWHGPEAETRNEAVKFPKLGNATSFGPRGMTGAHLATNTTSIYST